MKTKILHSVTCTLAAAILVLTFLLFPVGPMPIANAQSIPIHLNADCTLDSDMTFSGTGFFIEADNITLNLNGHTITGSYSGPLPYYGVLVSGHSGVTIKNGTIQGFVYGVALVNSNGNVIKNIVSNDNYHDGCLFNNSNNNAVNDCTCVNNGSVGIIMCNGSDGNIVNGCTANNNGTGVSIIDGETPGIGSNSNTIKNTVCNKNSLGGIFIQNSDDNIIMDNTTIKNGASGISVVAGSDSNEIRGNHSSNNGTIGIVVGWIPTAPENRQVTSVDNSIVGNKLSNNTLWDIRDNTPLGGPGTAGTWNSYEDNKGRTSNPEGLVE